MTNELGVGTAHGKIILIGEHAVVYGVPALALPLTDLKIEVQIQPASERTLIHSTYFSGALSEAPAPLHNLQVIKDLFVQSELKKSVHFDITISSDLPNERGMGSSAAVATAFVRALYHYFDLPLREEVLDDYVMTSEKIVHGNPSGLDALIVKNDTPYLFKRDVFAKKIPLRLTGYLVIADSGQEGQTKAAIASVDKFKQHHPQKFAKQLENFEALIASAVEAIKKEKLDTLGQTMNAAQKLLVKWTVSNDKLDQLVNSALEAGALGAKLTGGGRGGCMIALAATAKTAQQIAQALEKSGAAATWIHSFQ